MGKNKKSAVVGGSAVAATGERAVRVADNIKAELGTAAQKRLVKEVQVGLIYTAVQIDTGALGVAYTFPEARTCGGTGVPLKGRTVAELVDGLGGKSLLASAVALAAVNALLADAPLPPATCEADVLDSLDLHRGDRVCMVGCFAPLLKPLKDLGVELKTFDQVPKPGSRPAAEVEEHLPGSEVAIITATSLINNTLDHLLKLASPCREVVLLGSSTPLLPEAFSGTPVSNLSGIRVEEPEGVLRCIAEGQGFCVFKRYVRKVSLRLDD